MSLSLGITGAGLVTSVGTGLAERCATLRAQVSAPAEVVAGGIVGGAIVGEDDSLPVVGPS